MTVAPNDVYNASILVIEKCDAMQLLCMQTAIRAYSRSRILDSWSLKARIIKPAAIQLNTRA